MTEVSFERITQGLVNCFQAGEEARFLAGDILKNLPDGQSLKEIASEVGRSTSFLASLRQVAETFAPEERAQDQSWSVHLLAARTTAPVMYLEKAIENGWSVKDFREHLIEVGEVKPRAAKGKVCANCGAEV